MEILRADGITKIYKQGLQELKALDDVSFSVEKGEFVAIIGASGSGKSTLLHILGGVDKPTRGRVLVNGVDIAGYSAKELALYRRRQVGLIYQFYNLIPVMTAVENITMPLDMDGKKPRPGYLEEILSVLGLEGRENHLPNRLSGGQQQRVAIARRLITRPDIILADEPTGNLDSKNSKQIIDLLRYSNRAWGQTLVVITHDMQVAAMADRVMTISDGRLASHRAGRGANTAFDFGGAAGRTYKKYGRQGEEKI